MVDRETSSSVTMPTVLYIVGCGRSGSTLLERMLGAIPGFANGGELIGLFPRVVLQDQRCGCGEAFSACPFWGEVGRAAFDGWRTDLVGHIADLQMHVIRQRHVPLLVAPQNAPAEFRQRFREYVDAYRDLFAAFGKVSEANVIVDASKSPAHLLALQQIPGLDLRILNLVRDSRGVAHSWNKSGIGLPHNPDRQRLMKTYAPRRTALLWSTFQAESALLRGRATHGGRVRYEDLVASPRRTLERALNDVGLPPREGWLDHVDDTGVTLPSSHGIAGSRSRFATGRVELRLDDDWRSRMSPTSRRVVTALTLPQLLSNGYLRTKAGV